MLDGVLMMNRLTNGHLLFTFASKNYNTGSDLNVSVCVSLVGVTSYEDVISTNDKIMTGLMQHPAQLFAIYYSEISLLHSCCCLIQKI